MGKDEQPNAPQSNEQDQDHEGRSQYFMDIDRMINEGLGGGQVTINNGWIDESTTDTMDHVESVIRSEPE